MRLKIFIPIILILIIGALCVGGIVLGQSGTGPMADLLSEGNTEVETSDVIEASEPGEPTPIATPVLHLIEVVVAKTDIPVGEEFRLELLDVELRPETNVALMGQYTIADKREIVGQFASINISEGQEILKPMVAYRPEEVADFGSDVALYLNQGMVAVAFPINKFSGVAYALRPGDLVDALMTMRFIEVDQEFRTALPNLVSRVFEPDLLAGRTFLFQDPTDPSSIVGRLEHITLINQTPEIVPANPFAIPADDGAIDVPRAISRRATQLTLQQAEVIWVGTWRGPLDEQGEEEDILAIAESESESFDLSFGSDDGDEGGEASDGGGEGGEDGASGEASDGGGEDVVNGESDGRTSVTPDSEATPLPVRLESTPDVVILSMFPQDALMLKWAMDRGIDIDLVLRAQGDFSVFTTVSVSLPQIVDHSGWIMTEGSTLDLSPHPEDVLPPSLKPVTIP